MTRLLLVLTDISQEIVASIPMNTLYLETATELVSTFTLLRNVVAEGGSKNMLTGAERSETLWAINVLAESNLVEAIMYSPCRENSLDICVVIHLAE